MERRKRVYLPDENSLPFFLHWHWCTAITGKEKKNTEREYFLWIEEEEQERKREREREERKRNDQIEEKRRGDRYILATTTSSWLDWERERERI